MPAPPSRGSTGYCCPETNRKRRRLRPRYQGRRRSACRKSPPARSSYGCSRRNQIKSVISGDMCLGNDTSHARRDDFSVWNRVPACVLTFSKKRLVNFDKLTSRFFDSLDASGPDTRAGGAFAYGFLGDCSAFLWTRCSVMARSKDRQQPKGSRTKPAARWSRRIMAA